MGSSFADAKQFRDLVSIKSQQTNYQFDKIFSDESEEAANLSARKFEILKKIDSRLQAILRQGEQVYFLSAGTERSVGEGFWGWHLFPVNHRAIIFTSQRVLLLQINRKNEPSQLVAQIGYPILTQVNRTRLGSCKITFRLPEGSVWLRVPSGDCNFMSKVREHLKAQLKTSSVDTQGRENLCPRCFVQVSGFPRRCPHCRQGFKSAKKAGWLSFLFPGLGNFYLKNRLSGFLEFSGAFIVWMAYFLGARWMGVSGPVELSMSLHFLWGGLLFVSMHGTDAMITSRVGKKGVYPLGEAAKD